MAYHSYIEFRGARRLESDGALDVLAGVLKTWATGRGEELARWLEHACQRWLEHMATMPPGLRDLVLDTYLTASEQEDYLAAAVRAVQTHARAQGPSFLPAVCEDLLAVLGSKPEPPVGDVKSNASYEVYDGLGRVRT